MRRIASALLLSALALGLQPATAANSQQDKVKTCTADVGTKRLKGDARRSFMKQCLSADSDTTA